MGIIGFFSHLFLFYPNKNSKRNFASFRWASMSMEMIQRIQLDILQIASSNNFFISLEKDLFKIILTKREKTNQINLWSSLAWWRYLFLYSEQPVPLKGHLSFHSNKIWIVHLIFMFVFLPEASGLKLFVSKSNFMRFGNDFSKS